MRKRLQIGLAAGLLLLLAAAGVGIWLTSGTQPRSLLRKSQRAARAREIVDQTPLETAERLSANAVGGREQRLAAEARRLADREVDQAFEQALRAAAEEQASLSGEALELQKQLERRQQRLAGDEHKLAELKQALARASGGTADDLQQQIALAEAERALDEDEVEDTRQQLARAGGDPQARIQRLMEQHNASQHQQAPAGGGATAATGDNSMVAQYAVYRNVAGTRDQLLSAQQQAQDLEQSLVSAHDALEEDTKQERANNTQLAHHGRPEQKTSARPSTTATAGPQNPGTQPAQSASLQLLLHLQNDQRSLTAYDKRIADAKGLAETYGKWAGLVDQRRRAALHALLISLAIILGIALAGFIADWIVQRSLRKMAIARRQAHTFRSMLRLAVQVVCALAVLVVIFGPPTQTGTMLGLVGAGLTFVLRDFILSFLGWFVLMGRNGIRIGDWVEIEGVRGEVVEIGLLRTVLLETGNWTDQGRPTGRKVSFANSFAMAQHYFNFSTASQWLWDELEVVIPPQHDPYPLVEAIREMVAKETAENQRLAAEEWQRVRRGEAGQPVSTAAHISLRPIPEGVDLKVRYVARASERYDFRSRLYTKILELLRQSRAVSASS